VQIRSVLAQMQEVAELAVGRVVEVVGLVVSVGMVVWLMVGGLVAMGLLVVAVILTTPGRLLLLLLQLLSMLQLLGMLMMLLAHSRHQSWLHLAAHLIQKQGGQTPND